MVTLLELVMIVFAVMAVTQVFLPMVMPERFDFFWMFKKRKTLNEMVDKTIIEQERIKNNLNDFKSDVSKKLYETLETSDKISNLEKDPSNKTHKSK